MNPTLAVSEKREEILALAARHRASGVRLFGSVARGEASEESDVDLLVDFEPGASLLDHAALLVDLEDLLQVPVDGVNARAVRSELREAVLREAVPL